MSAPIVSHTDDFTWSDYQRARARVRTLNRSLGQLRRRFVWNYERIVEAEAERDRLQRLIDHYGPRLEAWNDWFWRRPVEGAQS